MALSAPRSTPSRNTSMRDVALYQAVKVYQGALVCINTTHGYGVPGSPATTLIAIGVAQKTVDNTTGSSGDVKVPVKSGECYQFKNSADSDLIAVADRGAVAYIVDDQTVAKTNGGTTRSIAGVIEDVDSSGVWVRVGDLLGSTAIAAAGAVSDLETDLKSATGTTLAGVLGAKQVATVANANVVGGIEVCHRIAIADAATADTDVVLTYKTMITHIEVIKTGGAGGTGDTVQVKNGSTAITDAMSIEVADKIIVRPSTIDDAQMTISAGGTLKVTCTKASANNVACLVIVRGLRVA